MELFSEKVRAVLMCCGVLAGLLAGVVCPASAADYSLTFTGLHDGELVYGVDASLELSPFVNADNYSITASGDDSGTYTNVRFYSYGIYSSNSVNIENSGQFSLTATGGVVDSVDTVYTEMSAYAIVTAGSVANSGDLTVNATGGTATSSTGHAYARLYAYGIDALGEVTNDGDIIATATGGTATATTYAYAETSAYGIESDTAVTNGGDILATATGGTAIASGADYATVLANATAEGIRSESSDGAMANSGNITVTATGGAAVIDDIDGTDATPDYLYTSAGATASAIGMLSEASNGSLANSGAIAVTASGGSTSSERAYSIVSAQARGIESDAPVTNSGAITVAANGGEVTVSYNDGLANAEAYGIDSTATVDNNGPINVTATGGTVNGDDAYARAFAYGINADGAVTNTDGAIVVAATGGTAVASDEGSAYAEAYGILSQSAVTNTGGSINVSATGGSATGTTNDADGYAEAYGIASEGAVVNSGAITTTATGGTATTDSIDYYAYATADAYGIDAIGSVENSGAINVSATGGTADAEDWAQSYAYACGIDSDESVTNSGNITVFAQGGDSTSGIIYADSEAGAFGIWAFGDVTNSGNLFVSASAGTGTSTSGGYSYSYAEAYGIDSLGSVTNDGTISAKATGGYISEEGFSYDDTEVWASAYGIDASGDVTNSGAITATATGGTGISNTAAVQADAMVFGIDAGGAVTNNGTITVTAQGGTANAAISNDEGDAYADAWGIRADGDIDNSGAIAVSATGGTATADSSEPYALAIGLQSGGNVTNTGTITATATYGDGTGTDPFSTGLGDAHAGACGIFSTGGAVNNSGNITVAAVAPDALDTVAVGILFAGDGTLTSTGMLRATGDRAYEVAVMSGTVSLLDTYNMSLDGDPTVGSLFVNSGATLALNDAALTVSAITGETLFDTEYRIFETEGGTGAVTGAFGSVSALNPAISVLYHDQATVGSIDDTVSLSYQPGSSPQIEAIDLLRHVVTLSSDLVGQRLVSTFLRDRVAAATPRWYAASHTVASDVAGSYGAASTADFFFSPYFANVDKDASPIGYDADLVGFVTGLEQRANGNLYGFHIGFGHAGLDFTGNGYSDNQEDQDVLSAGLHLMGNRGNWTWRGQITGFYGWHDYEGLTGLGLEQRETVDYDSYGVRSTLLAGHMFKRGNQMLLPEAGVEYLWLHRESFTTDADTAAWDMHSDSLDEHQVSALASLRWLTCLQAGEIEITPSLAAGVRYLMTDDELDAHQSLAGSAPVTVEADQDDLTGTASASIRFRKDQLASELAYSGEFGDDTTMHSAWLRFSYLY